MSGNTLDIDGKEVLSVREMAGYLGISESKVREWIRQGRIPFVKLDGRYVFFLPSVREWLAGRTAAADVMHKKGQA